MSTPEGMPLVGPSSPSPASDVGPLYRFEMWAAARPDDPYYVTNWDGRQRITIVARTKQEAIDAADALLGAAGRDHYWTFSVISVTDHRIAQAVSS